MTTGTTQSIGKLLATATLAFALLVALGSKAHAFPLVGNGGGVKALTNSSLQSFGSRAGARTQDAQATGRSEDGKSLIESIANFFKGVQPTAASIDETPPLG